MPLSKTKLKSTKRESNYEDSTKSSDKLENKYQKPTYGNSTFALERKRMINSWVKSGQEIRRGLRPLEDTVRRKLSSFNLKNSTHLTNKQVAEVMRAVNPQMKQAAEGAMESLDRNLAVSLRRGVRATNTVFKQKGMKPLTREESLEAVKQASSQTAKPWPPKSPSTYDQRIVNASKVHLKQLRENLGKQYPKGKVAQGVMKNAYRGLRKLGATGVQGGSYANRLQMILASEETRITNEVTVRMLRLRGIEYAYWRLSPSHPWYGGGEICEWLASIPFNDSMEDLRAAGLGNVDQAGLHSMSNWPDYPHPWCKCYPEPAVP